MGKTVCLTVGVLGAILLVGVIVTQWLVAEPPDRPQEKQPNSQPDETGPMAINFERCQLKKIPPGTVIEDKVPEGWTNLIYTSAMVLTEENLKQVPKNAAFYALLLRYAMLAKVEKRGDTFELTQVAVGFVVDVKGKETIIDSKNTFKANLGAFGKRLLAENEEALDKDVQQVVQTATMRLIDDRQFVKQGKAHEKMLIRHAILVAPKTGQLWTFVWLLSEKDNAIALAEKDLQLLPDGLREKYNASIKEGGFNFLGVPDIDTFARVKIPQGKAVACPPALQKLVVLKEFTREQALELEKALRDTAQKVRK